MSTEQQLGLEPELARPTPELVDLEDVVRQAQALLTPADQLAARRTHAGELLKHVSAVALLYFQVGEPFPPEWKAYRQAVIAWAENPESGVPAPPPDPEGI